MLPSNFFFTLTFMLNPGTGELFSSGHSQERDKRLLKVVHSIEVLLQVNLLVRQVTFFNVKIEKFVGDNSRQSFAFPVSNMLGGGI